MEQRCPGPDIWIVEFESFFLESSTSLSLAYPSIEECIYRDRCQGGNGGRCEHMFRFGQNTAVRLCAVSLDSWVKFMDNDLRCRCTFHLPLPISVREVRIRFLGCAFPMIPSEAYGDGNVSSLKSMFPRSRKLRPRRGIVAFGVRNTELVSRMWHSKGRYFWMVCCIEWQRYK